MVSYFVLVWDFFTTSTSGHSEDTTCCLQWLYTQWLSCILTDGTCHTPVMLKITDYDLTFKITEVIVVILWIRSQITYNLTSKVSYFDSWKVCGYSLVWTPKLRYNMHITVCSLIVVTLWCVLYSKPNKSDKLPILIILFLCCKNTSLVPISFAMTKSSYIKQNKYHEITS